MPESDSLMQACCVLSCSIQRLGVSIESEHASSPIESLGDSARMARQPTGTVNVSASRSDGQVSESLAEENRDMIHFSIDVEA